MLKIWGRRSSINVQKVLWLATELKFPYEQIDVGGKYGGLDTPEFLAMNPYGRIPVINHDGIMLWESQTILRYLAAISGQSPFWLADAAQRGHVEAWMDWSQSTLQPDFMNGVFWGLYRTPEALRNYQEIALKINATAKHFKLLDQILSKQAFLAGDVLTLADIPAGTMLYRYFELEIDRPSIPHVERWYQQLKERTAYQQAVMVPFSEFKGKLDY